MSLPLECSCEVGLRFIFLLSQHLSPEGPKNKKVRLARNPVALVSLSTVVYRWEEPGVVTCPRQRIYLCPYRECYYRT